MFNLNQAVTKWRQRMAAGGIRNPAVLDELESHLREDLERQTRSGANVEQAFHLAAERIGSADELKREFEKMQDLERNRTRTLLRRWSLVAGIGFVYSLMSVTWYLGARAGKMEITWPEIALALGVIAPMAMLGWAGRAIAKVLPVINENLVIVVAFAALFLGALLFRMFFDLAAPANLVHLQILMLWLLSPTLGFGSCASSWYDRSLASRKNARTVNL
jgi:hypothetical protein